MRDQIEERLRTLMAEFKSGQEVLAELEARESNVRLTLARISGAIQVLEELLNQEAPVDHPLETSAASQSAATA